ncbi:spindle pole body component alp14 [Pyrenophora seminiperda CCB06]|uniref:Spindle pole body component alp14 n=1 Tax=Pyrenophora seminiperda CCB06 TaxID=1302712 RepID=A0A3M7MJB2_9PLEO|nr:spindle pole body component alp14 [Pyrenophora seminiperda CCB06]
MYFTSLPLPDRFVHKNWKVRKEAYEAAAKEFASAITESDPVVRQFISDASIWKGVVGDSNVAAQQEGLGALCAFLDIGGQQACSRTRNNTIATIAEKGLPSTRPAAKQKALEALMLYIETDKPDPVIEELLPVLGNKQPKVVAATLDALTQIFHAYGCKTIDPKQVLKLLPKAYGHADKNVRAKAQELTVEFYRWLKEGMKPLFWNDLKPVQQQDLEKLFEKVKDEPPPKQERLLRSQQAAKERAAATGGDDEEEEEEDAAVEIEIEHDAVDVFAHIPKDFSEKMASTKWKDRKETLDEVQKAFDHARIAEGPFDELVRGFAKCIAKDANVAVVISAANCVELLAKGLKKSFQKYRKDVMNAMMERLKEKKATVTDAIGAALDASFASTTFQDCLEEILEFLKHKNPQVKLESSKFLIRCLKNTREAPNPEQAKAIVEASTKLLTESQEVQRSAGAETFGTLWKIMGDRVMNAHLDGLDEIRKTKIKEFYDTAEVKSKFKPKAAPAPKPAAAAAPTKKPLGKRPAPGGVKKAAPAPKPAPPPPAAEEPTAPLEPKPTSRPGAPKLGAKPGLTGPSRLGGLKKPGSGLAAPSPRKSVVSPPLEEEAPPPQPKFGAGRGLAGRPLGKPAAEPAAAAPVPQASTGLSLVERAELDELRAEVERVRRQNEDLRGERTKLTSQIHELQNQNAQLIEDHTRDVLSIKAKETQLVRARSDFEASEQTVQNQRREIDRLKRELSRQVRASSPPASDVAEQIYTDNGNSAQFGDSQYGSRVLHARRDRSFASGPISPGGDGKENFDSFSRPGSVLSGKLSPRLDGASGMSSLSSRGGGRMSPAENGVSHRGQSQAASGAESWKRAAEVTQNLKQRIEMMKLAGATCPAPPVVPQRKQKQQQQRHDTIDNNASSPPPPVFDLSRAANEVAHVELLEFFKSTVGENVTSEVFAAPSLNGYGSGGGGEPRLRGALAAFFNGHFKPVHVVKPEHIVVTAGATEAIENVVYAVCDEGDSVLVVGPHWPGLLATLSRKQSIHAIIAKPPTYLHWDNYLVPSLQAAYDFSPRKTRIKAVLLCNPNTPLSRCYPRETLLDLMEFCQERNLHLICDEVSALLTVNGGGGGTVETTRDAPGFVSALSLTEPLAPEGARKLDPSRVHVVWSGSKLFGVGGLKVGCILSQQNPTLLSALTLLCPQPSSLPALYLSSLLSWSQLPTLLALTTERLTTNYTLLASCLSRHNIEFITPTHGVVLFARLAKRAASSEEENELFEALEGKGVRVGRGAWYSGVERCYGWAGIGFGCGKEDMEGAVARMENVLLEGRR